MYLAKVDNDDAQTRLLVHNPTTKEIEYRTVASLPGGSGISRTIVSVLGNTSMGSTASTDYVYFAEVSPTTLTLPAGNNNRYTVKNITGTGTITIDATGGDLIEGASTITLSDGESVDLVFNSAFSSWYIV